MWTIFANKTSKKLRSASIIGGDSWKTKISKEQLEYFLQNGFSAIASMLGVSLQTVRRRLTEFGLSVRCYYTPRWQIISWTRVSVKYCTNFQLRIQACRRWAAKAWHKSNASQNPKCHAPRRPTRCGLTLVACYSSQDIQRPGPSRCRWMKQIHLL